MHVQSLRLIEVATGKIMEVPVASFTLRWVYQREALTNGNGHIITQLRGKTNIPDGNTIGETKL
jgi:hypothetical protein